MKTIANFFIGALIIATLGMCASCSKDEDVMKSPQDIVGVWQTGTNSFLQFYDDYTADRLDIVYQDGISIGQWSQTEVYFYEPGYDVVIYVTSDHEADVYQIVELTESKLVWCWVDDIEVDKVHGLEGLGNTLGEIIKEAQEGFKLNPELYQTFIRIPEQQFSEMVENLDRIEFI